MKLNLPDSITSSQELKAVTADIQKYTKWFAQYSVKNRVSGAKPEGIPTVSEAAASLIKELSDKQNIDQQSLDELIESLENIGNNSPRIIITLAAPAPASLKKNLVKWCRENIDSSILVDFRFNSTLLGGMVVRYGSHVYDWSFRRQILAARAKFPEVLRRV